MSYIRCICGDGSNTQEATLWTNADPTANFATQTITLSDDMTNYDFLRVEGRLNKTDSKHLEVYVTPSYLFTCSTNTSTLGGGCSLGGSTGTGATGARYQRAMKASSSTPTQLTFATAYAIGTGSSTSTEKIIPTRVVGISYSTS